MLLYLGAFLAGVLVTLAIVTPAKPARAIVVGRDCGVPRSVGIPTSWRKDRWP